MPTRNFTIKAILLALTFSVASGLIVTVLYHRFFEKPIKNKVYGDDE